MSGLPANGVLASYWIPRVGIGNPMQYVHVPLTDVLNYALPTGAPQTTIVFLASAGFVSADAPYIEIPTAIQQQMTLQPGQSQTNVQQLQAAGIKVSLTLVGSNGYGWDGINDPNAFAAYIKSNVIDAYGLDGIDIDNEFSNLSENPQNFMNVIGALRSAIGGGLLTKALWSDSDYFTVPVAAGFPNAGSYLGQLLDLGSSMGYGYGYESQISSIQAYMNIPVGGQNVGMNASQLAIGVQAGPPEGSWMTDIDEVYKLAKWTTSNLAGMMLFTFSQDIQQFTYWPQNSPSKMYPNADDHLWQRTIVAGFLGQPQPSVPTKSMVGVELPPPATPRPQV